MEKEITAIELNPDKVVKLRCVIEHAQLSLRSDAYPVLIREGETAHVPEPMAFTIKGNKRKVRYGFEVVTEKKAVAAPPMTGIPVASVGVGVEDVSGTEVESPLVSKEDEAALLKQKRSQSAKKAAATRAANAADKKKE